VNTAQNATHRAIYLRPRQSLERTLLEVVCRFFVLAVLVAFLRVAVFAGDWVASALVGLLLGLAVLFVYERIEVGRRARAEVEEAEFRGWLARVNAAASRAAWCSIYDFTEERWRLLYARGAGPEEAVQMMKGKAGTGEFLSAD
jgi:hypothetical protein